MWTARLRSRERSSERHLLVDTLGLILHAVVHPADGQDRDGAVPVLDAHTRRLFPFPEKIFADRAYGGPKPRRALAGSGWEIEVVKRPADIPETGANAPAAPNKAGFTMDSASMLPSR